MKINKKKLMTMIFLTLIIVLSAKFVVYSADLPALIMVYDDGFKEDLEIAFPVHKEYNVPAVSAVNSDFIGKSLWLDQKDLHFLQSHGWEIANHGKKHAALILNSIAEAVSKGDTEIILTNSNLVEKNYNYIIFDQQKNISEKISIKNIINKNGNEIIISENELKNNYTAEQTFLRLDNNSIEKEILASKSALENMGLLIDTFVYPYNGYFSIPLEIVSKNYSFARAGYQQDKSFPKAFINQFPFEKYKLSSAAIESNLINEADIFKLMDQTITEQGLLIFYAHPNNEYFEIERVKKIIEYALKNEIEIITFKDLI